MIFIEGHDKPTESKDYQMTLPKFIICMDGTFRLGMVNQHKHLLKPGDQCIGGGYYHFDFVSNRIILDRESYA